VTSDVTDDAFLGGALQILQPKAGYRAGLDAVLLAAAVPLRPGQAAHVLDAGAGTGVVGLAVAQRFPDARVTLAERDAGLIALALRNVERNGLTGRVHAVAMDIARPRGPRAPLHAQAGTFDHALANPPYHAEGKGTPAGTPLRAAAHAMPEGTLESWVQFLEMMLRPGGTATMIHRADALAEVLGALGGRFGGLVVFPLFARSGQVANRILVQGTKGSRAPLRLREGAALHEAGGQFRPQIEAILRHGAPLPLSEDAVRVTPGESR
jgi:tRNA1(Val) A37 N6-methylase TrmN6